MRLSRSSGAVLTIAAAAVALALGTAGSAAPQQTPNGQRGDRADKKSPPRPPADSTLAFTAIGSLIAANGGKPPATVDAIGAALKELGQPVQVAVPFSAVALDSGLLNPRLVFTRRTMRSDSRPIRPGAGPARDATAAGPARNLPAAEATELNLDGRLFLAVTQDRPGADGLTPRLRSIEFISWNAARRQFDFGFIDTTGREPEVKIVDGVRCFSCHKNRGPIFGNGPWSNTAHNAMAWPATALRIRGPAGGPGGGTDATKKEMNALIGSQAPQFDDEVRLGVDLLRDRELFRLMTRTAEGRKAAVLLLAAIVVPVLDNTLAPAVDRAFGTSAVRFGQALAAFNDTQGSSGLLIDYSPSGSMGSLRNVVTRGAGTWGEGGSSGGINLMVTWGGSPESVTKYDARRAEGNHGLPSNRQPSNPRAFAKRPFKFPNRPSSAVNPGVLANAIGLTQGDVTFLTSALFDAVARIGKPKVTQAGLARDVFGGSVFAPVLTGGELPDREEFKDLFVAALDEALKSVHGHAAGFNTDRKDYASGPKVPPGAAGREVAMVPTTACLRCHEILKPGKPHLDPIPPLAFDPFDKAAREAWVKATDPRRRRAELTKLMARLFEDKDMPPEDAAEYGLFRVKDAAGFEAVRAFLEAELAKANGP
jgi:hypothetical protein